MILLGIDPGFRNCGYCLVETNNGEQHAKVLHKGTLKLKSSKEWMTGIQTLLAELATELADRPSPEVVAVEMISWYGKRKGVLALAHLAGAFAGAFGGRARVLLFPAVLVKRSTESYPTPKRFNEHEADALSLCRLALEELERVTPKKQPTLALKTKTTASRRR